MKMRTRLLAFAGIISFLLTDAKAQAPELAVSGIPDSLLKGADAVVRYDHMDFEVQSASKAVLKTKIITTVLNERADHHLVFSEYINKFRELANVEIKVYDKNGNLVSKAGRKQLSMHSEADGLIDDVQNLYYKVPGNFYPITIEKTTEVRFKGTLFYPSNYLQTSNTSVQKLVFTARAPAALNLRYKLWNTGLQPKITDNSGIKTYEWTTGPLTAMRPEPKSRNSGEQYPRIQLAPSKFEMDDYSGEMTTWEGLGKWYLLLFKKTSDLSEERKNFFRDLVKNEPDDYGKARRIYDYLQQNFRYVSIQLGIGGWRPLPASFTDAKKYGDCKGLSNYMQSALAAVGIASYQVIINRGNSTPPIDPAFPVNSFNHEILCIPSAKDTIWVECTSNTLDFGKLDASTENRPALLITPNGGVLVKTPATKPGDHRLTVHTNIRLSPDDKSGEVTTSMTGTGEFKYLILEGLRHQTDDRQKQILQYYFSLKQPGTYKAGKVADLRTEHASFTLQTGYDQVCEFGTGAKMFFNRHLHKQWTQDMPQAENRKQDVFLDHPFIRTDTTLFQVPEGYSIESLPARTDLSFPLGSYTSEMTFDAAARTVSSITRMELKYHVIPAAQYAEARIFFNQVMKDQGQKWILKKD